MDKNKKSIYRLHVTIMQEIIVTKLKIGYFHELLSAIVLARWRLSCQR